MRGMDIRQLVARFTQRLHAVVDEISVARARQAVMHALGEKRGRLPKGMAAILGRKPRRKGPRQLCPVPGCENAAAPVFGMVCAAHKGVSKAKIKQYREARRAAKLTPKAAVQAKAKTKTRKAAPAPSSNRGARGTTRVTAKRAAKAGGAKRPTREAKPSAQAAPSTPPPKPPAPASSETAGAAP